METIFKRLNPLHISDIKNRDHSSYFFITQEYTLLIMRFFDLGEKGLSAISTPYLLFGDMQSFIYKRDSKSFEPLALRHSDVADSIQAELERSEKIIMEYVDEIDKLEDDLFMRKLSPRFLDLWFDIKKDITRMERILERAYEALKRYLRYYESETGFVTSHEFTNLLEHIERYERLCSLSSSRLDTLYNYYNSLKNDKINKNIYTLTLFSGIFLPLNLVVGFFGINTEGLFFSGDPSGTLYVVWILLGVFSLFVLAIPLMGFLERYILRKLFGRVALYNKLIKKIKKLSLFSQP